MKSNTPCPSSYLIKFLLGGILIIVGTVLLLKQLGYFLPGWLISWPMLLVLIGIWIGAMQQFKRDLGWLIIVAVGFIFLLERIFPDMHIVRYFWPVAIIGFGLWILFGKHPFRFKKWQQGHQYVSVNDSDEIDDVSVFSAINKNIISKNFRGGEIVIVFGGVELNLTHADIQGPIALEITQIFGGTKIIIPSHWEVAIETVAIFAGTEDKRNRIQLSDTTATDKKLVIKGTSIFGGIEIMSYA